MKTIRIFLFFALLLVHFSCEIEKYDVSDESLLNHCFEDEEIVGVSDQNHASKERYQFPEFDWKTFDTHAEKVQALQVPEVTLARMDTWTLVRVLFDYPLLFDAFAFDDIQHGLEYTLSQFNAYHEWLLREDKKESFISFREEWESNRTFGILSPIEEGRRSLIDQLIVSFLNLPDIMDEDELFEISKESSTRRAHQGNRTAPNNYANYYATTPLGSLVYVFPRTESYSPSDILCIRNYYQTLYPNAVVLSDPTYSYNCHAYAWWMSEGGNARWMNDPSAYISDGSYIQTTSSENIPKKVAYYNGLTIDHSAVYTAEADPRLISKWGDRCLMKHKVLDCPYPTSDIRYYRLKWGISGDELIDLQLAPSGIAIPATAVYSVSDFPTICTIEWSVMGAASISNGQFSPSLTLSVLGDCSVEATMTNSSGHSTVIRKKQVKASHAPIITDIDFFQYLPISPGHYVMRAVANKSDGVFSWSTTGGTLQDLTYPDDASFMAEPQLYKEIVFTQPGVYTITVESMLDNHYYLYQKSVFVNESFWVSDY